jgi:hypothetical protein
LLLEYVVSLSTTPLNRRAAIASLIGTTSGIVTTLSSPLLSIAAPTDCYTDCMKNCNIVAPNNKVYCTDNCISYCEQDDRTDGLSGSISSTGGETGILGLGTVVKGEDKPPQIKLPGLDFSSSSGKKLIGY